MITYVVVTKGFFLLKEGDLACWLGVEVLEPLDLEVAILRVLDRGSELGVAGGGSVLFVVRGENGMGRVLFDRIFLL